MSPLAPENRRMSKKVVPSFSRRLKELRENAGLTQQGLATRAGLSMSLITQMEQGVKADPRLSTLLALSQALGVEVGAFVVPGDTPAEALPSPRGRPRRSGGTTRAAPGPEAGGGRKGEPREPSARAKRGKGTRGPKGKPEG